MVSPLREWVEVAVTVTLGRVAKASGGGSYRAFSLVAIRFGGKLIGHHIFAIAMPVEVTAQTVLIGLIALALTGKADARLALIDAVDRCPAKVVETAARALPAGGRARLLHCVPIQRMPDRLIAAKDVEFGARAILRERQDQRMAVIALIDKHVTLVNLDVILRQ